MSYTATAEPKANWEPIPGYVLKQRIAAGGFGEVWRAEAPGGLSKAIKLVYGTLDDTLASQELKSLNRIREVHHPFLLSLERIEVIDGRLMIVSELADGCLLDRFRAYRDQGLPGIPRDVLLGYLQDAAEVLDYLNEKYSLQHLDVKPQNLLLVGDHVKVGDFGLLREIHEASHTAMGGVSPMYAAPEVFSGKPSRFSDQYSLAILYQEMLTGEPPFRGRNTAQLAAQHLYSVPELQALPSSDQPVISRALSKTPEARFSNCRELIRNLRAPDVSVPKTSVAVPASAPPREITEKTIVFGEDRGAPHTRRDAILEQVEAVQRDLEPLTVARDRDLQPTLFVGVGGFAAQVLTQLRGQLAAEFGGNLAAVPALQMLLLDIDPKPLTDATLHATPAFSGRETLSIPLRPAAEYRAESQQLLGWMGRRWLFNVPRSLRTEALRPYGRLAFVDHRLAIMERLRKMLRDLANPDVADSSWKGSGKRFAAAPPKVFLVTSTSGATGGGLVIDLAYLVRTVLGELGLPDRDVHGILVHGHRRKMGERNLAIANTCACLSELRQLSQAGGRYYPDASCPVANFQGRNEVFHHTYFVDLGEELGDSEAEAGVQKIADYLPLNSTLPTGTYFAQVREPERETGQNSLQTRRVRSFGTARIMAEVDANAEILNNKTLEALIAFWTNPDAAEIRRQMSQTAAEAKELTLEHALTMDGLIEHLESTIASRARLGPVDLSRRVAAELLVGLGDKPNETVLATLDSWLAFPTAVHRARADGQTLAGMLTQAHQAFSRAVGVAIEEWILSFIDRPGARFSAARLAAKAISVALEKLYRDASVRVARIEADVSKLKVRWKPTAAPLPSSRREIEFAQYAELRARQALLRATQSTAATLVRRLRATLRQLEQHAATLQQLTEALRERTGRAVAKRAGVGTTRAAYVAASTVPVPHLQQIDLVLDQQLKQGATSLRALLDNPISSEELLERLTLATGMANLSRLASGSANTEGAGPAEAVAREQFEAAIPAVARFGGNRRFLVVAPPGINTSIHHVDLFRHAAQRASIVTQPGTDISLCCEVEQIPLDNILRAMIERFPNSLETIRRVHTRIDVDWEI